MGHQFDDDRQRRDWPSSANDDANDDRRRRDAGMGPRPGYLHEERDWARGGWNEPPRSEWRDTQRYDWRDPQRGEWRDPQRFESREAPRFDQRYDWREGRFEGPHRSGDFRMTDAYHQGPRDPYSRDHDHDRWFDRARADGDHALDDLKRGARRLFRAIKGYTRPDDRIREDVCDCINEVGRRLDADVSDVEVRVQNGEVTLAGSLRDRRQKHAIENAADSASGVKDVHNLVRVRRDDETHEVGVRAAPEAGATAGRGVTGSTMNRPGSA